MLNNPTTPFPQDDILVKHPLTGAFWNVAPLLHLVQEMGQGQPAVAAEAMYDVMRYLTAEQNSPQDSAARLREVLRCCNAVGLALDTLTVYAKGPQ